MGHWRSYDTIAEAYDPVWGPRFEQIAHRLLAMAPPVDGARMLDLGTGTGAVLVALGDRRDSMRTVVACDVSQAMLARVRRKLPRVRVLQADACALPLRSASVDVVTANCVLSHVGDYRAALADVVRVLARPGLFAMSSWGPSSDRCATAWRELVEAELGTGSWQETIGTVVPWEDYFSSAANVRAALTDAGFARPDVVCFDLAYDGTPHDYVADRELGASGRFARERLGAAAWTRFRAHAEEALRRTFGERVIYTRPVILAAAPIR